MKENKQEDLHGKTPTWEYQSARFSSFLASKPNLKGDINLS